MISTLGTIDNPIRCHDPIGERNYLHQLVSETHGFIQYKRIGSFRTEDHLLDGYAILNLEGEQIADLPEGNGEAACKRAMILFALRREPEIMHAFVEHDKRLGNPKFADDMIHRVLPFVCPRFLNDSAQCPNRFVLLCLLLSEMWAGERLGNWPAL